MAPPPARLLPLLILLFHLPFSLSSRRHHHHTPSASPTPSPSPASSDSAPLAVLLACNATRFQPTCVSTLSGAGSDTSASDLLAATLSSLRARIPPAVSTAKSVLAASSNVNLTNAATNCLIFLSLSSHRLSPSSPSLLSASTAMLHLYDCWSSYKYVNFSHAISDAMAYLDDTIAVNSNYISMLAARQRYGDKTSHWRPPQTERDGYWPPAAASAAEAADVDALGVPRGLPANATVCAAGCEYKTVREAVAAAPDYGEGMFVVRVKEGVYRETVSVPWEKTNVVLVGDGMGKTVITGDLNADTPGVSTFNTATVDQNARVPWPTGRPPMLPKSSTSSGSSSSSLKDWPEPSMLMPPFLGTGRLPRPRPPPPGCEGLERAGRRRVEVETGVVAAVLARWRPTAAADEDEAPKLR
ncbi:unnamed protein product [Urochloa decumbens]|uniref:Pectinesterase n=1 Tax=Urochloa decumbens TaxID=240449 RepID=A0ABC8Z0E6_9POAL